MAGEATVHIQRKDLLLKALDKLGEGSRFLWMIFIFTMTPPMFNGMHSLSYIFIAEIPTHWCAIPELIAANWTSEQIRNISSASPCTRYNYDYENFSRMGFDFALTFKNSHDLPTMSECKTRSFADNTHATSIVQEWDLVCDKMTDRSNTHMALSLGKLIGSAFFGVFADKYGRKISYVIGLIILIVSGPLSAIVPWYWGFMLLRLLTGMSHAGIQYSSFTTLTEVAGEKHRQWMGVAYNTGYPTGVAIMSGIAYAFHDWRHVQLASTLPALILLIHMWLMPESPRWLISQGREDEAQKVIEKHYGPIYETSGVPRISTVHQPILDDDPATRTTSVQEETRLKKDIKGFMLLVTNYELRRRIVITNFAWMTASLSYYALALNVDNFSADHFIYVLVLGITEIPAYLLPTPILMVMGRRQAGVLLYTGAAFCLLSILAIPTRDSVTIMIVALIGRFALSAVYGIVILYTSELFPTVSRNSAVGTNSAMSHVGSVAAPYVADLLGAAAWWAPSTLCGALALISGLLCLMLPETRGRSLADTVDEEITKERGTVSLRNCYTCGT